MMNMAHIRCPDLAWFLLLQSVMLHALCHDETTRNVYMIGFMENQILNAPNSSCKLSLHIVNTGENTTCVNYQTKGTQLSSISLPGRTTRVVPFSEEYMVRGSDKTQRGIRVESGDGVIIYGVNRFNETNKGSMDGFLSIPVTYADTCFYAVTLSNLSQILLVGTVNGTSVNVTLRTNCRVNYNQRPNSNGTVINTTLDEYETLQLQCSKGFLTGTFIQASHPVSVFSGNKRQKILTVPTTLGHLVEQIPSVNSWGMYFVNIPPTV
ncbi:IgGFc-binding protein-like [Mizuhopecten yessoensis]|uniref:IgGFc-binding protein-like n=1 Tax=Mizuhopecten yessoensis TaxID=6573 RepID=UPI000B45B2AF|nr:IgGFc-binding protein-like [Mizuhopecten yessoensis]